MLCSLICQMCLTLLPCHTCLYCSGTKWISNSTFWRTGTTSWCQTMLPYSGEGSGRAPLIAWRCQWVVWEILCPCLHLHVCDRDPIIDSNIGEYRHPSWTWQNRMAQFDIGISSWTNCEQQCQGKKACNKRESATPSTDWTRNLETLDCQTSPERSPTVTTRAAYFS